MYTVNKSENQHHETADDDVCRKFKSILHEHRHNVLYSLLYNIIIFTLHLRDTIFY